MTLIAALLSYKQLTFVVMLGINVTCQCSVSPSAGCASAADVLCKLMAIFRKLH
jgi:hypothetical protein